MAIKEITRVLYSVPSTEPVPSPPTAHAVAGSFLRRSIKINDSVSSDIVNGDPIDPFQPEGPFQQVRRIIVRMLPNGMVSSYINIFTAYMIPNNNIDLYTDYDLWASRITGNINSTESLGSNFTSIWDTPLVGGGSLEFSYPATIATIGYNWQTWSGGYTGQVLGSYNDTDITIMLSENIIALGFYVEQNDYDIKEITITLDNGQTISQNINGYAGAGFFGFYGGRVASITISISPADYFAFGNFKSIVNSV